MAENTAGVQSIARIFKLIEVLCNHPRGAGLQTISTDAGLAKCTEHRLLAWMSFPWQNRTLTAFLAVWARRCIL